MKTISYTAFTAAVAAALLINVPSAPAQNAPPAQPSAQGERGDRRGGFNFEEFRQRMNDRLKTSLKVTDDEWAVLQPLIEKVQTKQRDALGSRFGGVGGRRGGQGGGDQPGQGGQQSNRPPRAGEAESQALRTALENESTSAEDLKAKLTAVREVRKKSEAEMAQAREELRKVVTVRQEAVLVSMGILE